MPSAVIACAAVSAAAVDAALDPPAVELFAHDIAKTAVVATIEY
jgi:hypothetical protein